MILAAVTGYVQSIGYTVDTISPRSFYLEERKSSRIIIQRNQDELYPAASTIKLIAVMVARESLKDKIVVRVPYAATRVEPTKAYLREGEKFHADDLLNAMVVKSANDAALAIAIGVSGSEKEFVKKMNKWCSKNGISDTRIYDVTGLSQKSKSSARSLARIFKIFIGDEYNLKMLRKKRHIMKSLSGREIVLGNSNNLNIYRNESGGVLIGKTGFTKKAKYCFAGLVTFMRHEYFIVIMGADMAWHELGILMDYANEKYLQI